MRKRFFVIRNQRGYTLVEMISMLMILAVLSSMLLVNTKTSDKRQQLRDAAQSLVAAARQAESYANASKLVNNEPRLAYGMCLTNNINQPCSITGEGKTFVQIYARKRTDTNYTNRPGGNGAPAPDILANFDPKQDIRMNCIENCVSADVWVDYLPPAPTVYVTGQGPSAAPMTVRVQFVDPDGGAGCEQPDPYHQDVIIRPGAGAIYVQ